MWFSLVLLGVTSFLLHILYKRMTNSKVKFWEQYGIRQVDASAAASTLDVILGKKDITERDDYTYQLLKESGEKFCGLIEVSNKVLFLKDVELIRKILIKDFEHFPNRRDFFEWAQKDSVLLKMLASTTGDHWRDLRNTLSPTFTSGKIRRMMGCFNMVGKEWATTLKSQAKAESTGSLKVDLLTCVNQFTVDAIAATAFGFKAGAVENPNSEFSKMAFRFADFNIFKMSLGLQFPDLLRFFRVEPIDLKALRYFQEILGQGLQLRLKGTQKHNDFLQLLAEAKKGELKAVADDELNDFEKDAMNHIKTGKKLMLTDEVLNAQSLLFFLAGFTGVTNFITFSLYALAAHPEVQTRLREEVDKIAKENGDFDHDELAQLEFMEMFVCEVLRLFPPVSRLERICSKDFKDPESGLTVPKGALVSIPILSIHKDPEYYDNPTKFDPEGHFSPEKKSGRSPYAYLPFGSGPRNCIGMRFALIEGKAAAAHMVHNFLIEPTEKTPLPMKSVPGSLQIFPPKGLQLKLTPRKK